MKAALVRPAVAADLPQLPTLSVHAAPAADGEVLLVAQTAALDDEPGALLAALRLRQAIGLTLPRVWYHVGCTVHAAPELGLFHRQRTLMLGTTTRAPANWRTSAGRRKTWPWPTRPPHCNCWCRPRCCCWPAAAGSMRTG